MSVRVRFICMCHICCLVGVINDDDDDDNVYCSTHGCRVLCGSFRVTVVNSYLRALTIVTIITKTCSSAFHVLLCAYGVIGR